MSGKKLGIIAVICLLLLGGAGYGYYTMKMNAPAFQGIGLPVSQVTGEQRKRWADLLTQALEREDVIKAIVEESDYVNLMGSESEAAAIEDLKQRLTVRPQALKGTIEVGVTGKRKEMEQLKKIGNVVFQVVAGLVSQVDPEFKAAFSDGTE